MNITYFLIVLNLLLLLLILRLSFSIYKLPKQITALRRLLITEKDHLAQFIGADWITDSVICPGISRVENRTVYFEDGVEIPEPREGNNGFMVGFGTRKIWYENMQMALNSAYAIATTNKCCIAGITDVESN